MDKILAMSLLSAGPGLSCADGWLSHLTAGNRKIKGAKDEDGKRENIVIPRGNEKFTASSVDREHKPRFALEFDGLNWFDTIVSH